MQTKESYWEGMYWDGLDARDLGAVHLPDLSTTIEQMRQDGELKQQTHDEGQVLSTKVVPKFLQMVQRLERRPLDEYWVSMTLNDNNSDSKANNTLDMHLWHQDVFYGSRALGIADPGTMCMTYQFDAVSGKFKKRTPM